jgi:hypothetical protein
VKREAYLVKRISYKFEIRNNIEIQTPEFSKQGFRVGWPEIRATLKVAPPSTELRTGSIIRATCVFDAKKVVPGTKTGELTRCQKRNKKNFAFFNFTSGYQRI